MVCRESSGAHRGGAEGPLPEGRDGCRSIAEWLRNGANFKCFFCGMVGASEDSLCGAVSLHQKMSLWSATALGLNSLLKREGLAPTASDERPALWSDSSGIQLTSETRKAGADRFGQTTAFSQLPRKHRCIGQVKYFAASRGTRGSGMVHKLLK